MQRNDESLLDQATDDESLSNNESKKNNTFKILIDRHKNICMFGHSEKFLLEKAEVIKQYSQQSYPSESVSTSKCRVDEIPSNASPEVKEDYSHAVILNKMLPPLIKELILYGDDSTKNLKHAGFCVGGNFPFSSSTDDFLPNVGTTEVTDKILKIGDIVYLKNARHSFVYLDDDMCLTASSDYRSRRYNIYSLEEFLFSYNLSFSKLNQEPNSYAVYRKNSVFDFTLLMPHLINLIKYEKLHNLITDENHLPFLTALYSIMKICMDYRGDNLEYLKILEILRFFITHTHRDFDHMKPDQFIDYYQILNLKPDALSHHIYAAYASTKKLLYDDPRVRHVKEAYVVLMNAGMRKAYDEVWAVKNLRVHSVESHEVKATPDQSQWKQKKYYEVLGVNVDASADSIRSQYIKIILKAHPDKGGSDADFRLIKEAYDVLSNDFLRAAYNASLKPELPKDIIEASTIPDNIFVPKGFTMFSHQTESKPLAIDDKPYQNKKCVIS